MNTDKKKIVPPRSFVNNNKVRKTTNSIMIKESSPKHEKDIEPVEENENKETKNANYIKKRSMVQSDGNHKSDAILNKTTTEKSKPKTTTKQKKSKTEYLIPPRIKNQGLMFWSAGTKSSKTFSGIDVEDLLLALPYYIQTGNKKKAIMLALEGYRFLEFRKVYDMDIKYIQYKTASNVVEMIYDKCVVTALKSINAVHIELVISVVELYLQSDKKSEDLYKIVSLLCDAFKSNHLVVTSYLFMTEEGREKLENARPNSVIFDEIKELDPDDDYSRWALEFFKSIKEEIREDEMFEPIREIFMKSYMLRHYILEKDSMSVFNCLNDVLSLTYITNIKSAKKYNNRNLPATVEFPHKNYKYKSPQISTKKSTIIIWKALEGLVDENIYNPMIEYFYKASKPITSEVKEIYALYTAILCALLSTKCKKFDINNHSFDEEFYNDVMSGKYKIDNIDEFKKEYQEYVEFPLKENVNLKPLIETGFHDEELYKIYLGE